MSKEGASVRRVLIVEDEMLVSMYVEDLLEELGYESIGPAAGLEKAVAMARAGGFDAAILDVNLNGRDTFAVADILREHDIPFVFATGYGPGALAERFRNTPTLSKPFQRDDLERALSKAMLRQGIGT